MLTTFIAAVLSIAVLFGGVQSMTISSGGPPGVKPTPAPNTISSGGPPGAKPTPAPNTISSGGPPGAKPTPAPTN